MLIIAISFAGCKDNNGPTDNDNPCPECLLIKDINNCPEITTPTCIKFDDAITKIPDSLYMAGCSNRNYIVGVCGKNIESVGIFAFTYRQVEWLCLPNIKHISNYAFRQNLLTTLDLENVEYIGHGAFSNNLLTKLYIPNIKCIGVNAFSDNPNLTEVHIYTDPALLELDWYVFPMNTTITVYIKNKNWKSAMEEKFKEYNVVSSDCNVIVEVL